MSFFILIQVFNTVTYIKHIVWDRIRLYTTSQKGWGQDQSEPRVPEKALKHPRQLLICINWGNMAHVFLHQSKATRHGIFTSDKIRYGSSEEVAMWGFSGNETLIGGLKNKATARGSRWSQRRFVRVWSLCLSSYTDSKYQQLCEEGEDRERAAILMNMKKRTTKKHCFKKSGRSEKN